MSGLSDAGAVKVTPIPRYRCATCGVVFAAWAPAQRHADAEHHHRVEWLIPSAT